VVGFAEDENNAQRWLASHSPDLVIVDLFLRGGSGLGVLHSAQAATSAQAGRAADSAHGGSARRLVVLSNYATPAMRERCLALGADGVFDKSTEIDALIAYCQALALQHS
jgi:DNA-binding NarL/FixJ family response regulator